MSPQETELQEKINLQKMVYLQYAVNAADRIQTLDRKLIVLSIHEECIVPMEQQINWLKIKVARLQLQLEDQTRNEILS